MLNKTPYRESFYTSDDNTISRPFNFADGDNLRNILKAKTTLALMRGKRTHTLNFCRKMDLKSYVVKICTFLHKKCHASTKNMQIDFKISSLQFISIAND